MREFHKGFQAVVTGDASLDGITSSMMVERGVSDLGGARAAQRG